MNESRKPSNEYTELKLPEDTVFSPEPTAKTISGKSISIVLLGLVFILFVILVGLLWWGYQLQQQSAPAAVLPEQPELEEDTEAESAQTEVEPNRATTMSVSDELDIIATDLKSTETLDFTAELNLIRSELE